MSNTKVQSSNEPQSSNDKIFDLEERTAKFGENIIKFAKTLERNEINRHLISQVVRAGTSVGANYMEADGQSQRKTFGIRFLFAKRNRKKQNIG